MATARALSLPEIVLEVLEHVFDEPVSERRPLLFALAQVSRIFRDPAVRMLWVDMPNIEPLFRLLSNCEVVPDPVNAAATGEDEDGPSYTLTLRGPTSDDEIARLSEYAQRIRSLDFSRPGKQWEHPSRRTIPRGITLDAPSLQHLLSRTGLPLLPSLTKLKLPVTPPYTSDPTFLLCPSLRDLTISFPGWSVSSINDHIGALFGGIFAQHNRLTHLRVQSESYMRHDPEHELFQPWMRRRNDWMMDPPGGDAAVSQVFCDALAAVAMLNDLQVFSMFTMNTGVAGRNLVAALANLPRLRECSFGFNIAADILPTIDPGFASLRVLSISNVDDGAELRLFNSPLLRDLSIYHPDNTNTESYRRTIEAVAQRFPHLHRLLWKLGRQDFAYATRTHILAATIQPLFALDGLRELSIDVASRPVYDDDIALLAGGLPRLSHLEVKFYMDKIGPTARSLLTLAQGCPSLHTLHLGGLFITEADEANAATYPFVGNRLRYLNVADLRCEGEIYAAMIVDVLFPFLDVEASRRRAAAAQWPKGQFSGVLTRLEGYHAARE